jgi:hypothetical protein
MPQLTGLLGEVADAPVVTAGEPRSADGDEQRAARDDEGKRRIVVSPAYDRR